MIDPCQKERDEFKAAKEEFDQAEQLWRQYSVVNPLSGSEGKTGGHDADQLAHDFAQYNEAEKRLQEKLKALFDCQKANGQE